MQNQNGLQIRDAETLELIVGIPVAWTSETFRDEAEKALTVRKEAQELGLADQVLLQENLLRTLAFVNQLAREEILVQPLEGSFDMQSLGTELMPPTAVKVLHTAKTMPHPIEIQEWAILKPSRRTSARADPYLAFRIAGQWYSIFQWE